MTFCVLGISFGQRVNVIPGLDFTAEEDSSTDSSVEGQSDDEGHDDLMDLELECDEEEEEEEESQSSVTVDGHETSELES